MVYNASGLLPTITSTHRIQAWLLPDPFTPPATSHMSRPESGRAARLEEPVLAAAPTHVPLRRSANQ
jgi:hypothetical protein